MSVYLDLTREFNRGGFRAILSSGQAVVLHRLAIMSKDGDWILRETPEALEHVLGVLATHGASYRFGAPLDVRWMQGGWSAHFQFRRDGLRVRTDFVTRPPRLGDEDLDALWREPAGEPVPFVDARRLVEIKKTNREKDYAVIGELARLLESPRDQLLCSRSARDILALARARPDLVRALEDERPVLRAISGGREAIEAALDAERRMLVHANEERLRRYLDAAADWAIVWPQVGREITGRPLPEAHAHVVERARGVLPTLVTPEDA
ncbi:MAG: hypothetical protein ACC662_05620 [Planctomycetota bacterium]